MKKFSRLCFPVILAAISASLLIPSVQASELKLAVANSTCSAIKKVGDLYQQRNKLTIDYLCKSSGRLAKGLNGRTITADVYISANQRWMNYMIDNRLVQADQVISPWGNELVVAARKDSSLNIGEWSELSDDKVTSILIGDPGTAPFGRYAKQAMQATGIWEKVKNKIATRKHITLLAETLAESDNGTVGILFASNLTDAHRKLFSVDKAWHPPIRYFMAPVESAGQNDDVNAFLKFIVGSEAKAIFSQAGFQVGME